MPNLWLTGRCDRVCDYCFLDGWLNSDSSDSFHMPLENVEKFIEWLGLENPDPPGFDVDLMGGEPLQHPEVVEIIGRFSQVGHVNVRSILTNGLVEPALIKQLLDVSPDLGFLINVDHPDSYTGDEWARLNEVLELLSPEIPETTRRPEDIEPLHKLQLAITFFDPDQPFDYFLDLAKEYEVRRVRYAPSHASPELTNDYLDFEGLCRAKDTIVEFVRGAVRRFICPNLECILPPCIFTPAEWELLENFTHGLRSICDPHLDVLPDLNVVYCGSMMTAMNSYHVSEFSPSEIEERHRREANEIRGNVADRCKDCEFYHHRRCQGFCLRYRV